MRDSQAGDHRQLSGTDGGANAADQTDARGGKEELQHPDTDHLGDGERKKLSANAMQADVERGMQAGFKAYLSKPIDVTNFLEVLEGVLKGA